MNGSISVQLTPAVAGELLGVLETRRAQMEIDMAALDADIANLKTQIKPPIDQSSDIAIFHRAAPANKGETDNRIKRGDGPKIVGEYLRNLNGDGATIGEITGKTHLVYNTVRRALKILKAARRVRSYGGTFRWIQDQT